NILSIKGEVADESGDENQGKYHIRERYYGNFQRSISMPGVVDADKITAETENGTLVVHLPKKPETQPKKISVNAK
ncbi:MAG: Hsp20/alpha crystallin family protein, partial [Anaerolineaceae bacterium]|nr:Hsp20/alpha crystallin family protein [Anaerolineaceae bacterium]